MHVQLFVPALIDPDFSGDAPLSVKTPALDSLLGKGRRKRVRHPGTEAWLLRRFGVAGEPLVETAAAGTADTLRTTLPVAPYALLGEGSDGTTGPHPARPGDAAWMCADPVHLRVDRDRLVLADATLLELGRDEADALCESLNRHFGDVMTLIPARPDRWYARLKDLPDMSTTPLRLALGAALEGCMPEGPDGGRWRAIINEAQMLIHEHPVNLAREAAGKPAANGIWFWGAGRLQPVAADTGAVDARRDAPLDALAADSPLARGLARSAGIAVRNLPDGAERWLDAETNAGVALIVVDSLERPAAHGDAHAWHAALAALERHWFSPLLAALRHGQIGMVTLLLGGHATLLHAETVRADLRYFWRRPKPLAAYLGASSPRMRGSDRSPVST